MCRANMVVLHVYMYIILCRYVNVRKLIAGHIKRKLTAFYLKK